MITYQRPARHNEIWSKEDDAQLNYFMRLTDASIREVAEQMGRTPMAVLLRARKAAGIDPSYEDEKAGQVAGQAGEQVTSQVIDLEAERANQAGEQVRSQVGEQVRSQVISPIERIVLAIGTQNLSRQEIMDTLSLKGIRNFRENYLEPSIRLGYVNMLYSSSNRPDQAYYLTKKGLKLYQSLNNK